MQVLVPRDEADLAALVSEAAASGKPLLVEGGGGRAGVGRPVRADARLDLSAFSGVIDYDPMELVLTAGAATPLAEIEALLAAQGQMLAFEPPRYGKGATLGGALGANASGPRRLSAGAARDHLLGFRAVTGRGEAFKAGGRVVKNVTGFDLSKVMAGSWGTLAVMTEVSVKVLPAPRTSTSVLIAGLTGQAALGVMARACASPAAVSGAAFLPAPMAGRSAVSEARSGASATVLRIEGFEVSVAARLRLLQDLLAPAALGVLDDDASGRLWREIRDGDLIDPAPVLWRLTGTADRAGMAGLDEALLDWAGSLAWTTGEAPPRGFERGATLWRGPEALRLARGGAPDAGATHAAIAARLKDVFDPADILNRGRLHAPLAEAS